MGNISPTGDSADYADLVNILLGVTAGVPALDNANVRTLIGTIVTAIQGDDPTYTVPAPLVADRENLMIPA